MTNDPNQAAMPADRHGPPIDWPTTLAQHDRWLRTVVIARVGGGDGVDEVMQEVLLAAVAQRAPIADLAKLAPWLYRLAVRQSLLYRRRLGRRRKLFDRYADRQRSDRDEAAGDPLEWLLASERKQLVRHALTCLAPRDAEILLLKYAHDWSYHQIASHLGTSHSAVETRLHRARGRLRTALENCNVIEVT